MNSSVCASMPASSCGFYMKWISMLQQLWLQPLPNAEVSKPDIAQIIQNLHNFSHKRPSCLRYVVVSDAFFQIAAVEFKKVSSSDWFCSMRRDLSKYQLISPLDRLRKLLIRIISEQTFSMQRLTVSIWLIFFVLFPSVNAFLLSFCNDNNNTKLPEIYFFKLLSAHSFCSWNSIKLSLAIK